MVPFRPRLIEWLKALALGADEQFLFLKKIGGKDALYLPVDELALEYYEIILLLDQFREKASISPEAERSLRDLNEHFSRFSGRQFEKLWTYDALQKSKVWEVARVKARRCLALLGEEAA